MQSLRFCICAVLVWGLPYVFRVVCATRSNMFEEHVRNLESPQHVVQVFHCKRYFSLVSLGLGTIKRINGGKKNDVVK
jgi:hypothetical protein